MEDLICLLTTVRTLNYLYMFFIIFTLWSLWIVLSRTLKNVNAACKTRGGALNFFQVGVCGPDFRSVGLANWHLPLKSGACERKISKFGGLWAENFQIWGLVSWKFPNLGACELKFGWKLRLLRLKFPKFLKRGSCELTLLLEMGPLRAAGEAWKGGLQGRTSPYPLSRSVPPPDARLSRDLAATCWNGGHLFPTLLFPLDRDTPVPGKRGAYR